MIKILDGKLTVSENQRFIGFAGDNLNRKIEFLIKNRTNPTDIYRLYLTFDDGTVNYFTLPATVSSEGTLLTWDVKEEHIFKSGIVYAQIKVFSRNGVVFHTNKDFFIVGSSTEFSDFFENNNTEFLEYERKLNSLRDYIEETAMCSPYIGENGNWFVFDSKQGVYVDSGKSSVGESLTADIADGAVTTEKIAENAVTPNELDRLYVEYLGIPSIRSFAELDGYITSAEDLDNYKTLYRFSFDTSFPKHGLLGDSVYIGFIADYYENETPKLMLVNTETSETYSYIRGSGEVNEVSSVEQVIDKDSKKAVSGKAVAHAIDVVNNAKMPNISGFDSVWAVGEDANPEILAYQTKDSSVSNLIRIPLNLIRKPADYVYLKEPFKSKDDFVSYSFEAGKTYRFTLYNTNGLESFIPGEYLGYAGLGTLNFRYLYQVGKRYVLIGENENRDIRTYYDVDKTYSSNSENAQSGLAVAQAISESLGDVETLLSRI